MCHSSSGKMGEISSIRFFCSKRRIVRSQTVCSNNRDKNGLEVYIQHVMGRREDTLTLS